MILRQALALRSIRTRLRDGDGAGFTLIELLIVVIILSVLVALAVMVMGAARRNAWNNTAKYNNRVGCTSTDNIWLYFGGLNPVGTPSRYNRYYDGLGVWARSMSRYETRIKWVNIDRPAVNRLRNRGTWKNNVVEPGSNAATAYYNWDWVYGRVGVYRGYRNTATNQWINSATTGNMAYAEVTVVVLTQGTNKAYYTSYRLGSVIASGSFTWTPGNGNTVSFGP
ncbi:MAG: prepilin-type N-terminal cleavage/methylation domain-containing protein [Actinobacteria bacterium]|nr:prepilin-type N-terminal cleavage/methylation domain-containing protein [Actinomycetota bacterium]MBU1942130.1 prepilin-type N-terminal cleavage/methylation domain-containing protein [Actinomycetota bacterium]MBU2686686.1 prepilin-type N-terminal cleavage/methylation domain-containing protein [Actinomycetota bacterium]